MYKSLNFISNSYGKDKDLSRTVYHFGKMEIIDGIIELSSDYNTASSALITYHGIKTDEFGDPLIRMELYNALSEFCKWQYYNSIVTQKNTEMFFKAREAKEQFMILADRARATEKMPNEQEKIYNAAMWNRILLTIDTF